MKIGIISDTHNNYSSMLKAFKLLKKENINLIIHCGDWTSIDMLNYCKDINIKIIGVFGNNEIYRNEFKNKIKELKLDIIINDLVSEIITEDIKIGIHHGHRPDIIHRLINESKYNLLCFGHTHYPLIEKINNKIIINPGSVNKNRNIEMNKTIAIYDTETKEKKIIIFNS
jgi:uncharacterized protein